MPETALANVFSAMRAPTGEYRGASTALRFSSPEQEFAALREGCGVFDLGWKSRARVEGQDRVRWLNGMISNNIRDLQPGHGVYAFVLNPQGRIQGDLYAFAQNDSILLETDVSQASVFASLKRYIIMDKVTLTEVSDEITGIGVQGPRAAELLRKLGVLRELAELESERCELNGVEGLLVRLDAPVAPRFEILAPVNRVAEIWQALVDAGVTPVGSDALELMRIFSGITAYGVDIRDRDLPQETGQMRALSFTKGCYIGQEIVERIRSRGQVHRQFTGFLFDGELPQPGAKVEAEGKEVAEITSAAVLPLPQGEIAAGLGYIRREVMDAELRSGETRVRLSGLPFQTAQNEAQQPTSAA